MTKLKLILNLNISKKSKPTKKDLPNLIVTIPGIPGCSLAIWPLRNLSKILVLSWIEVLSSTVSSTG